MESVSPMQVMADIERLIEGAKSKDDADSRVVTRVERFKSDLVAATNLSADQRSERIEKLLKVLRTTAQRKGDTTLTIGCGTALRALTGHD